MANITTDFNEAASGVTDSHGGRDTVRDALRDGVDDVTELRTQFIALLAKLDLDAGVTDTDYESTLTPAELKNTKGA